MPACLAVPVRDRLPFLPAEAPSPASDRKTVPRETQRDALGSPGPGSVPLSPPANLAQDRAGPASCHSRRCSRAWERLAG